MNWTFKRERQKIQILIKLAEHDEIFTRGSHHEWRLHASSCSSEIPGLPSKSKMAYGGHNEFRKMLTSSYWMKILAPNLIQRCNTATRRFARNWEWIHVMLSNESREQNCVDLGDDETDMKHRTAWRSQSKMAMATRFNFGKRQPLWFGQMYQICTKVGGKMHHATDQKSETKVHLRYVISQRKWVDLLSK